MTASNPLRILTLTPDGTMPTTQAPVDLAAHRPRKGGAFVFEWRIEFVDADGKPVTGGTTGLPDHGAATVQWYSIGFRDPATVAAFEAGPYAVREQQPVEVATLGAAVAAVGGTAYEKTSGVATYPWPRLTAITAPVVLAKQIRVLVGGAADGTYRLGVDANALHAYVASSKTATQIRAGLLALINDAEVVAIADPDNVAAILVTGAAVGTDFTLTLSSTGSALTQAEVQDLRQPAVGVHVHLLIDRPAP